MAPVSKSGVSDVVPSCRCCDVIKHKSKTLQSEVAQCHQAVTASYLSEGGESNQQEDQHKRLFHFHRLLLLESQGKGLAVMWSRFRGRPLGGSGISLTTAMISQRYLQTRGYL